MVLAKKAVGGCKYGSPVRSVVKLVRCFLEEHTSPISFSASTMSNDERTSGVGDLMLHPTLRVCRHSNKP